MAKSTKPERGGKPAPTYSAQDARGGEIILKHRSSRAVSVGGLIAAALAMITLGVLSLG